MAKYNNGNEFTGAGPAVAHNGGVVQIQLGGASLNVNLEINQDGLGWVPREPAVNFSAAEVQQIPLKSGCQWRLNVVAGSNVVASYL